MALLTATNIGTVAGITPLVANTLTISDTLTFKSGGKQWLQLVNTTGSAKTLNIKGDQATMSKCSGLGPATDISSGVDLAIPATEAPQIVRLSSISQYLEDANNLPVLTGADGVTAYLLEA